MPQIINFHNELFNCDINRPSSVRTVQKNCGFVPKISCDFGIFLVIEQIRQSRN